VGNLVNTGEQLFNSQLKCWSCFYVNFSSLETLEERRNRQDLIKCIRCVG